MPRSACELPNKYNWRCKLTTLSVQAPRVPSRGRTDFVAETSRPKAATVYHSKAVEPGCCRREGLPLKCFKVLGSDWEVFCELLMWPRSQSAKVHSKGNVPCIQCLERSWGVAVLQHIGIGVHSFSLYLISSTFAMFC